MFGEIETFAQFVAVVVGAINLIVWLLSLIALVLFMWNGVLFLTDTKGGTPKAERKKAFVWSLVALFILLSIAGITNLLMRTFLPDEVPYRETWIEYPVPIDPDAVL